MSNEDPPIPPPDEGQVPNKPYLQRFIWNIIHNSWKMLVTQQIIPTLGILLITTLVGMYRGLITPELSSANLKAALLIIVITLCVVLLINILRAPFQLDRQQEEIIVNLELQISELRNQLVTQNQPQAPIFYCKNPRIIGVALRGLNVAYEAIDESPTFSAAVVDFLYEGTVNSPTCSIKASATFHSVDDDERWVVEDTIWLNYEEKVKRFDPGDTNTLVVALLNEQNIFLYEHNTVESQGRVELMPNRKQIEGKDFRIDVTMAEDNAVELIADEATFKLSIVADPIFKKLSESN